MKSTVPVVFATDDNFAPYCGVSIASLIDNASEERQYELYVFYDDLSSENINLIESMSKNNVRIECVCISEHIDRKLLYTHRRLTVATYYRFFVADVLPQYDKLLYLDSDIVILSDVGKLFDIDIKDNLLGGTVIYRNAANEAKAKTAYLKELMDVSPDKYINAGILLMNLKGFREHDVKNKCLNYIAEHRELKWLDQDVLNAVCKGKITFLPETWNMSQFYFENDYAAGKDVSKVSIIHYLNNVKPWLVPYRCSHLYFYQYAKETPYAEVLARCFLTNNCDSAEKNFRQEVLTKAYQGKIGPKFLLRCTIKWIKGKIRRLFKI